MGAGLKSIDRSGERSSVGIAIAQRPQDEPLTQHGVRDRSRGRQQGSHVERIEIGHPGFLSQNRDATAMPLGSRTGTVRQRMEPNYLQPHCWSIRYRMFSMAKQSRKDWVRAALERLAEFGIEAVRVEPLARSLGVTKGSFYWHFRDRAELLDAMLEEWADVTTERVIAAAERAGPDPMTRLRRLTLIASEGYLTNLEVALRVWARRDASVERIVDQVDRRRLGFVRDLIRSFGFSEAETEVRTYLLYTSLIGKDLLAESHGRISRKQVLEEAFLLLTSADTGPKDIRGKRDGANPEKEKARSS